MLEKNISTYGLGPGEQWLEILDLDFFMLFKIFEIQDSDYYPCTIFIEKIIESFAEKIKGRGMMSCKAKKIKLIDGDFYKFVEELHSITLISAFIKLAYFSFIWAGLSKKN